jgi:hypothetical protein
MAGVSAASDHNASCCVKNADRGANAGKRGSRNARVVCFITLYMFCKATQSAALQLPRFARSCNMALRAHNIGQNLKTETSVFLIYGTGVPVKNNCS